MYRLSAFYFARLASDLPMDMAIPTVRRLSVSMVDSHLTHGTRCLAWVPACLAASEVANRTMLTAALLCVTAVHHPAVLHWRAAGVRSRVLLRQLVRHCTGAHAATLQCRS